MHTHLETDRLLLRPLALSDHAFIIELLNTKGWLQFIGDRNITNQQNATEYINKVLNNSSFFYGVFELKETKTPIGIITFLYRPTFTHPDIGFAMLPKFEKKGYALEAAKNYLNAIKKEQITKQVLAITKPENKNSIQLLKKLGLVFDKLSTINNETLALYNLSL